MILSRHGNALIAERRIHEGEKMFKIFAVNEGWAVFLVNRYNEKDFFRVSPAFSSSDLAQDRAREYNRILRESK